MIQDIIQTNGQLDLKVFMYKIKTDQEQFNLAVVSPNASIAKEGIKRQFNSVGVVISYLCTATKIMQIQ